MVNILFISLLILVIIQQIVIFRLNRTNIRLSINLDKSIGMVNKLSKDYKIDIESKYKELMWELSKPIHRRKPPK